MVLMVVEAQGNSIGGLYYHGNLRVPPPKATPPPPQEIRPY